MEIRVTAGNIQSVEDELIVVNLFEDVAEPGGAAGAVDQALGGAIREAIAGGDFRGKKGETLLFYTRGALPSPRALLVGLGPEEKLGLGAVREVAAVVARRARELGVTSFSSIVHGAGRGGLELEAAAQAIVEGSLLSLYRYQELKNEPPDRQDPELLTLVEMSPERVAAVEDGALAGQIIADAVCLARDLVNRPANYATPEELANIAMDISSESMTLRCQVLSEEDAEELGMGAFLGVAQGSDEPGAFIVMEHRPQRDGEDEGDGEDKGDGEDGHDTIVLVGKGITFDSGGISLKPGDNMDRMRGDMAGGAAVLATMQAVAELDLPLHVVGLVPATENLPSGHAYKPGDVLRAMNGKTIEIISTDAEGRLVLADALAYAAEFEPDAVIDLATLTGACVVALGQGVAAGAFTNDEDLLARLQAASETSGERIWHLPLYDEYMDKIESLTADMTNSGGRQGGVGSSAIFLKQFVDDYPWVHLDIAGMSFEERGNVPKRPAYLAKGGTGFGVRLLVQFLRDWVGVQGE